MSEGKWPELGEIILVQDRPTTEAQKELWVNRQPPTRKGEVVEVPKPDGSGFLVIDVGGEYGGVNYPARDFGVDYTWKSTGEWAPGAKRKPVQPDLLTQGQTNELLTKLRDTVAKNKGSRVAPYFRSFMNTFERLDNSLTAGSTAPSDWE